MSAAQMRCPYTILKIGFHPRLTDAARRSKGREASIADIAQGTPNAKCLASVIVTQAADHITADCFWKNERFAVALGVSVDTIKRAFRALADAGWLIRQDGRGRGNVAGMTFTTPRASRGCASVGKGGNPARKAEIVERKAARVEPGKRGKAAPFSRGARKRKRVQDCTEKGAELHFPPTPPYKDTPNILQRARATDAPEKPRLNTPAVAHHGGERERAWNSYLTARNWPCLADLGIRSSDADGTGWEVPFRQPPSSHDAIPTMIAARWVEWAISKREDGHAAA